MVLFYFFLICTFDVILHRQNMVSILNSEQIYLNSISTIQHLTKTIEMLQIIPIFEVPVISDKPISQRIFLLLTLTTSTTF
jgi:hypothetical protein